MCVPVCVTVCVAVHVAVRVAAHVAVRVAVRVAACVGACARVFPVVSHVSFTHSCTCMGEVHGPVYPAFPHKLRTGPWQLFGGTSTHESSPLDEAASNNRVSRSREILLFEIMYCSESCLSRPEHFPPKSTKNHQKKFAGLRLASLAGLRPSNPPK